MNLASLFNLEAPDLFVILVIVLLLFGAKRFPDFAPGFGEALRAFRKALHEFFESRDRSDRASSPVNLFNLFASVLLFVALTLFLLALAGRSSH